MAPAIRCASISPWFRRPKPAFHRGSPISLIVVAAPIVARALFESTDLIPVSPTGSITIPSVSTIGVKEWPEPATRTFKFLLAASLIILTTSPSLCA